jgi:coenzyme F420 hydrogenase subunit beta
MEGEDFGIYRRLTLAQTTDRRQSEKCQDGGAVAALLAYALQSGTVEGVALSGVAKDEPLRPVPTLATIPGEVWENAGTRYSYSPNLLAFHEGVKRGMKSLAFVGTPCQIHALRKIQMIPLKKFSKALQLTIGLMCTESFTYKGFFEKHLNETMGIDLADVANINIKGQVIVRLRSGREETIPLSEAKQYTRESCKICDDFSAELADISAGGLGLDGWTFIILRTEQGERIFDEAVKAGLLETRTVDEAPRSLTLLTKLSRKKRQNAPARAS